MAHKHSVYDTNLHFTVDPVSRVIANQVAAKSILIQGDHNSERFTFELPRLVDGHDITLCDKIEVHYINISADKKSESRDVYRVDDVQVSPDSEDVAIFSWLISGNATKYEGVLSFLIRFVCMTGETLDYAWHTGIYSNVTVGEGMNNGESVLAEYSDILESWITGLLNQYEIDIQGLNHSLNDLTDEEYGRVSLLEKKLPDNEGSSSHRVFVAAPNGFEDENGYPVSHYLKRIAGYDGKGKTSSNGDIGVITKANRDRKVAEGFITEADGAYENYVEHDEPTNISIACRDKDGRLVVEDGEKPFHAVNKRQLDAAVSGGRTDDVLPSKTVSYDSANSEYGAVGWYRLAKATASGKSCSGIFRITVSTKGGRWHDLIITAAQCFDNAPQIGILSHQIRGTSSGIGNIRIVYDTSAKDTDGIKYNSTPSYLEINVIQPLIFLSVSTLGSPAADESATDYLERWKLTDISLTETLETDFIEYTKSTTATVWADIAASSADINNMPTTYVKTDTTGKRNVVYGRYDGGDTTIPVEMTATMATKAGTLVKRSNNGNLMVPLTPTNENHATSKSYVDGKVNSVKSLIANSIALATDKETREADVYEFLYNDFENFQILNRNALSHTVKINIESMHPEAWVDGYLSFIPRKPLEIGVPVECIATFSMSENCLSCDLSQLYSCVVTLEQNNLRIRIIGELYYVEEWWNEDIGDYELAEQFQPIDQFSGINEYTMEVLATEEVLALIPTNYSLRRDYTELELDTLEKLNNTEATE